MNILILALLFVVTATARFQRFDSSESSWSSVEGRRLRPPSIPQPPGPPRPPGRPLLPSSGCPREWMTFERPNGVWCVMVGHSTTSNGSMSQPEAEATCVRHGATLTGFQNDIERVTVAAEALKQVTALGKTVGELWLGATKNPGCAVASCERYSSYIWTDGHTTGTDGFHWGNGEPENANWG
ncbi:hypothetical protein L3Y34_009604 [Caenorhabditis briggsae]|uniref:C-type lectin domain-containing protein n=1 Tax=Caenorhabditis briggsae TaxID=6238 RepID=A0AAE9A4K0_CAEBR|nr:hypothetical protein L3Y34_009604 [Caenorhabditis briggsae]